MERPRSIPSVARGYGADEVRRLLAVVPDTAAGRRARAILLTLVFKPGGMLTISVAVAFPVDEEARLLGDVVVDDQVRVTLITDFGLRTTAVKPPEVVSAWKALLRERWVDISGMVFESTPSRRLKSVEEVQVSRARLQSLIVEHARQVTDFLLEHSELRAFD